MRVVKGRSKILCTKYGRVSGADEGGIKIILDCGHSYVAQRDAVILDGNRRCTWCRGLVPADDVRTPPFWTGGGDLCSKCWVDLEIDKHVKRIAAAEKLAKPKRRRAKK